MPTTTTKAPLWNKKQEDAIETIFSDSGRIKNADLQGILTEDQETKTPIFNGKNVAELRGKVVKMGYYQIVTKTTTSGKEAPQRKMSYVKAAETMLNISAGSLDTFEKASKPQLEVLVNALKTINDSQNAKNGVREPEVSEQ